MFLGVLRYGHVDVTLKNYSSTVMEMITRVGHGEFFVLTSGDFMS